jgi:hypothetical protein
MVEPTQDREGEDLAALRIWWQWPSGSLRNLLLDALMRPGSIEVVHVCVEHAVELLLMHDEQMIEALTSHTAEEALTDGIGSRGVIRGFENLNMTRCSKPRKTHPKFAIVITDEVLRSHSVGCGFSKLLRGPSVGGRACHAHMDYFA